MFCIFVRHGNTFESTDTPVWIGSKQDLPLTNTGLKQATRVGENLIKNKFSPTHIYCSSLKRTKDFAFQIVQTLNFSINIIEDSRLNEIDYGKWGGLSDSEIINNYGNSELELWNEKGIFPTSNVWGTKEKDILIDIQSFIKELKTLILNENFRPIIITSNGTLRLIYRLFSQNKSSLKVSTGHICVLDLQNNKLISWNIKPEDLNLSF